MTFDWWWFCVRLPVLIMWLPACSAVEPTPRPSLAAGFAPTLAIDTQTLFVVQVLFQSISSLALVASLLYTSAQFAKSRRAAHVANFTKLVELQMHLREMRVNDPALAKVYRHDVIGRETDEEIRQYFFNLMQLSVFEIVWFGHREGQLPDDYFQSWERRMREIAGEQSFRDMMGSPSMKILHDDFQRYVTKLVSEIDDPGQDADRAGARA